MENIAMNSMSFRYVEMAISILSASDYFAPKENFMESIWNFTKSVGTFLHVSKQHTKVEPDELDIGAA